MATAQATTATDFFRSCCHYVPNVEDTWRVRIQLECRAELIDANTGVKDEYLLGVRTQTGAWQDPPQMPGYDFWMIFSKRRIYMKRVQASSFLRVSSHAEHDSDKFIESGWRLLPVEATPLRTAEEIRDALTAWRPIVAKTVFKSTDGSRHYAIEHPVKWAEADTEGGEFRVQTGPVILLDPDRIEVGEAPQFDDFQWAYLDFHDFETVRCLIERPTSVLTSTANQGSLGNLPGRNPILNAEQVAQIENRLCTGWEPPLPAETVKELFQTNHHSAAEHRDAATSLYALPASRCGRCRDEEAG